MRLRLLVIPLALFLCCEKPVSQQPAQAAPQKPAAAPKAAALSVDDVLAWRTTYGDLLGKSKDAAVNRYGQPSTEDAAGVWTWEPSAKTDNRMVTISYAPKLASQVKIYARDQERVDPLDVLKRAAGFNFTSGSYKDSTTTYFVAETKDGRNDLQFDTGGNDVTFNAVIFK